MLCPLKNILKDMFHKYLRVLRALRGEPLVFHVDEIEPKKTV